MGRHAASAALRLASQASSLMMGERAGNEEQQEESIKATRALLSLFPIKFRDAIAAHSPSLWCMDGLSTTRRASVWISSSLPRTRIFDQRVFLIPSRRRIKCSRRRLASRKRKKKTNNTHLFSFSQNLRPSHPPRTGALAPGRRQAFSARGRKQQW